MHRIFTGRESRLRPPENERDHDSMGICDGEPGVVRRTIPSLASRRILLRSSYQDEENLVTDVLIEIQPEEGQVFHTRSIGHNHDNFLGRR